MEAFRSESYPGSVLGLDAIRNLLEELNNPHLGLKYVHVAGTNGKGSTCAFINSILIKAGYKTGLFISPAITGFNEQIQVGGSMISNSQVMALAAEITDAARRIHIKGLRKPSFFEMVAAMAFMHFKRNECDIVVLETGLGGRLDATNIINECLVAAITNIGLDHTETLGDTIELIAAEKAGIIKDGCAVVLYAQSPKAEQVVSSACRAHQAELLIADVNLAQLKSITPEGITFSYGKYGELTVGVSGAYQIKNAVTAITIAEALGKRGFNIEHAAIKAGLLSAHWPGRFELLQKNPYVVLDGAHNPQSAQALMKSLSSIFPGEKISFVFGTLADKDYLKVIELSLPLAKQFYAVSPPNERALNPFVLAMNIEKFSNSPVAAFSDIPSALNCVMNQSSSRDIICIFGSLYQAGEIRKYFGRSTF